MRIEQGDVCLKQTIKWYTNASMFVRFVAVTFVAPLEIMNHNHNHNYSHILLAK